MIVEYDPKYACPEFTCMGVWVGRSVGEGGVGWGGVVEVVEDLVAIPNFIL